MSKISPGIVIAMLGFGGMLFTFVDNSGVGSKIPIVLFFLTIFFMGMILEIVPKYFLDDTYGEVGEKRGFS